MDPLKTHPLQPALDRGSNALYSPIDLYEISSSLRPSQKNESLYKAVISASIAALEEYFEEIPVAYLSRLNIPEGLKVHVRNHCQHAAQSPSTDRIHKIFNEFGIESPKDHWAAVLETRRISPHFATRKNLPGKIRLEVEGRREGCEAFQVLS